MNEQGKEITGFFCRWILLGGVLCSILVLGRVSFATAREIPAQDGAGLIVSDEVRSPSALGKTITVRAYIVPTGTRRTRFRFIAAPQGGRPVRVWSYGSRIEARLPPISEGLSSFEFKGLPYGRFAFERSGGIYRTIPDVSRVFAIDASLAASSSMQELRECVGVLRGLGYVIFLAETDLDEYARIRPVLRREFPDIPQICKVRGRHGKRGGSFDKLRRNLDVGRVGPLIIVTSDRKLAERALSQNAAVEWIGTLGEQDAPDFARNRRVGLHDSLAELGRFWTAD